MHDLQVLQNKAAKVILDWPNYASSTDALKTLGHNMTFLHILPNFNPLRTLEVILFFTFISENLQPLLPDLVPRLGCELEKMTSCAKIPHGLEL